MGCNYLERVSHESKEQRDHVHFCVLSRKVQDVARYFRGIPIEGAYNVI